MGRNAMEYLIYNRLFEQSLGHGVFGYLAILVMISLVGLAVFKPDRIISKVHYRLACLALFAAILIPAIASIILHSMGILPIIAPGYAGSGDSEIAFIIAIQQSLFPIFLAFSVLFLLFCVSEPRRRRATSEVPVANKPHPLDD